jgi:competence protein ComFC
VLPQLTSFKRAALNILFPQRCVGCGDEGEVLCGKCKKSLKRIVPQICPRCGKPQSSGNLCNNCISRKCNIDGIRSPFKFEGVIREAIHQFKYRNLRCMAEPLAALLIEYLNQNPLEVQIIVPVPLSTKRLRERGYNQSELLARKLSELTRLPRDTDSLKRVKYILPQALTKTVEERWDNVKMAFSCVNSSLNNADVLLLDDVSTSGATLDACAMALKESGASSVWGLVVAREL